MKIVIVRRPCHLPTGPLRMMAGKVGDFYKRYRASTIIYLTTNKTFYRIIGEKQHGNRS
jgi:hypothetical protein